MNSLYVDKFYAAQTEYEEIVFGDQLRDGMTVLLESAVLRVDMDNIHTAHQKLRGQLRLDRQARSPQPLIRRRARRRRRPARAGSPSPAWTA